MLTARQCRRFRLPIPLKVRLVDSDVVQSAKAANISSRGVYFLTSYPFLVGEPVDVSLTMPAQVTREAIRDWVCHGRVVRTETNGPGEHLGVAVEFLYYETLDNGSCAVRQARKV
jgi:PilZ domain